MFTGLVQDVGTVAAREGCRLTIATALPGLALGDSVACAGCCLTVVEVGAMSVFRGKSAHLQPFIKIYSTEFKVFLKSARGIPRPLFF
jgi:riboflavin synthase alpha subunit